MQSSIKSHMGIGCLQNLQRNRVSSTAGALQQDGTPSPQARVSRVKSPARQCSTAGPQGRFGNGEDIHLLWNWALQVPLFQHNWEFAYTRRVLMVFYTTASLRAASCAAPVVSVLQESGYSDWISYRSIFSSLKIPFPVQPRVILPLGSLLPFSC